MNKGQTVKGGLDVNIPNALSILRILLTPLFAALYLRGQTGAAVAVLLLSSIRNGLTLLRISSYYQQLITGVILLCAVITAELRQRRQRV